MDALGNCLGGLSWIKGLLCSPELARNIQETRSHARWTEVGPNNGPYKRQLTSFPFVLRAKVRYLGHKESGFY